jgi:hypothetical protein
VVPVLIAIALTSRANPRQSSAPRIGNIRPASACATAHAAAGATARSVVKAQATVRVPVRVTEQLHSPTAVVTVSRRATVVESASVARPISVRAVEAAVARACGHGSSTEAAHGIALQHAYQAALAAARVRASESARHQVTALVARFTPGALAQAKTLARAKALANARIEQKRLAH